MWSKNAGRSINAAGWMFSDLMSWHEDDTLTVIGAGQDASCRVDRKQ